MLQLNNFCLVFNDLLVSVDQNEWFWIHFFEESWFLIEKKLILTNFCFNTPFKWIQFLIVNGIFTLWLCNNDFLLQRCDFIFFCLNLFNQTMNCVQVSLRYWCFNMILELNWLLLVQIVPFLGLISNLRFYFMTFYSWSFNGFFQIIDFLFIVAWLMIWVDALWNIDLSLKCFTLTFQLVQLLLCVNQSFNVWLSHFILLLNFLFHFAHVFLEWGLVLLFAFS